jgi:peptidoglycan-associated lipoprotein
MSRLRDIAMSEARRDLALGDKRAQEAKRYLVLRGISVRIETFSYGEERPVDRGHNETAWSTNRRAHFVMKHPEP